MNGSVIQGYFPHGAPRASSPAWVQQAMGRAIQPSSANPSAIQLTAIPHGNAHGGQPLPAAVRQPMEAMFGTTFANVRIHVGPHAAAIGALAFTQGSSIHFAPGHYDPATVQGRRVLAHELTHVVQQRAGRVRNPFGSGVALVHDRMLEAEAERMSLRVATLPQPPARAPIQRMTPGSRTIQLWPRALTKDEATRIINEQIEAACRRRVSSWTVTELTTDTPEYQALVVRLRGSDAAPDGWMNEKAAKIYAAQLPVDAYIQAPRRLTTAEAKEILHDEILHIIRPRYIHASVAKALVNAGGKEVDLMMKQLRGTDPAPENWQNMKAAVLYARGAKLVDKYVEDTLPTLNVWPRRLTVDEATAMIHLRVKEELKKRAANDQEVYPKREVERIQGKTGEKLKEFKDLLGTLRGTDKRPETFGSASAALLYLAGSDHVEKFITTVLRIPNVPLVHPTTLHGTRYTRRDLFCTAVRAKHAGVDDDNLRNAVSRMDNKRSTNLNSALNKVNALNPPTSGELLTLRQGMHVSFGLGTGGCTFFYTYAAGEHTILGIGYHVLNGKNYDIVWAVHARLLGRWSF